jgi:hypothetical protein
MCYPDYQQSKRGLCLCFLPEVDVAPRTATTMKNRDQWLALCMQLILIACITLAGCTPVQIQPQATDTVAASETRAVTATAVMPMETIEPQQTTKLVPPLDVHLTLVNTNLVLLEPFSLTISITPQEPIFQVTGKLENTGNVLLLGETTFTQENLDVAQSVTWPLSAQVSAPGEGHIQAEFNAFNDMGQFLFSRTVVLYVLATETEVLTGLNGPLLLQLELLENQLASGEITDEVYQARRDEVLGGGATETIEIVQPTATAGQ